MSYSTPAMIRLALVPTKDGVQLGLTNTAADLTDEQLQDAITEADSLIDSYIGGYYAVPVATPIPHPIDYWSRNIATYNATITYRGSQDFTDSDPVARRYIATMEALKMVAAGKAKLQLPQNLTDNAAVGVSPAVNPYRGDLWTTDDFDLTPPLSPSTQGPFWRGYW